MSEIIRCVRPLGDLDQLVRDLQNGGGEKIRSEYQQALDSAA